MTATPKDLQDEVGRLREALKQCCYCDDPAYRSIEPCIACEALAQPSPESAGDVSQNDSCNTSTSHKFVSHAETQPQACEHWWKPYAVGIYRCMFCGDHSDSPNSPQEPQTCEPKIKAPPTKEQL